VSKGRLTSYRLWQLSDEGSCRWPDAGPYYPRKGTAIATTECMNEILNRTRSSTPCV
jgi:hypothetical protein